MPVPAKRALALLCAPLLAVGLSACAQTVSTTGLKGESKNVAETIKNLETDVTAGEQTKICKSDLSSAVVARLNGSKGGCKQAIKNQLAEIDSFELTIQSVSATPPTATARVESVYSGKKRISTVSLVKEDGKWKISALS
jgi:copper chaperone CopZ